jgi:peptidoglycan-associated lipoprotein
MNNIKRSTILILTSFVLSGCCGATKSNAPPIYKKEIQHNDAALREAGDKVYFTCDSATLSKEAKQILIKQGEWLKTHLDATATIEGHCDEIGTDEYNLILGLRRAEFVKNFLIKQGIDEKRLSVISYGKTKPVKLEHNKYAYRANRSAVTTVFIE